MTNSNTTPASQSDSLHFGVASMGLGGTASIMAPVTLMLAALLSNFSGFDRLGGYLAAIGGYLAIAMLLLLTVIGFCYGIKGILAARKSGATMALGLSGAGLCLFAFFINLIAHIYKLREARK